MCIVALILHIPPWSPAPGDFEESGEEGMVLLGSFRAGSSGGLAGVCRSVGCTGPITCKTSSPHYDTCVDAAFKLVAEEETQATQGLPYPGY